MKKMKRILLILNIILIIAFGIMIANLSEISYRHSRLGTYNESSRIIHDFYAAFHDKIIITWIIWGLVFALSLIQIYLEFRKGTNPEEQNKE